MGSGTGLDASILNRSSSHMLVDVVVVCVKKKYEKRSFWSGFSLLVMSGLVWSIESDDLFKCERVKPTCL